MIIKQLKKDVSAENGKQTKKHADKNAVLTFFLSAMMICLSLFCMSGCKGKTGNNSEKEQQKMDATDVDVKIERKRLFPGFDGRISKSGGSVFTDGTNTWISWALADINTSDIAGDYQVSVSRDDGRNFSEPTTYSPYTYHEGNITYSYGGAIDCFSTKHNAFISVGYMCETVDGANAASFTREVCYLLRDRQTFEFTGKPKTLPFPFDSPSICPHGQPIEYENGDFLLSFYYTEDAKTERYKSIAIRYSFDGENMAVAEVGNPIANDSLERGLGEPSITKYKDKYYMTIRSNENAYLAWSDDGLNYCEPILWTFDDGSILGSCNTQQRWISHDNGLFLVYTRKGAHNDHVFRNRAPLFMARVDEDKKCVIRDTEVILVPELGANLAVMIGVCNDLNFDNVSYILATEWMARPDFRTKPEDYGSDNSVWFVKITTTSSILVF